MVAQDEAINGIVEVYQSFLLGMGPRQRPQGSFLFLGPTGTGKTRLAEAVAESLIGEAKALIKINCGEFQHGHEVAKLTGSPPGYFGHRDTAPMLSQDALDRFHTEKVKLSFVLFDEIEKANSALWNLLLGILDRGTLTLGDNRLVDFSRTMIFLTGNVGAFEMAREAMPSFGLNPSQGSTKTLRSTALGAARRRFSPEFLNRIDKIVVFQSLAEAELRMVLGLELKAIEERLNEHTRFLFSLTEDATDYVLREGTDSRYGARHLKRTLQRSVLNPLCNLLATSQVHAGDHIRIDRAEEGGPLSFYRVAEGLEFADALAKPVAIPPIAERAMAPVAAGAWWCF